jgi:protein-S-isoprenylcysteine O-methyltransferase Ste14
LDQVFKFVFLASLAAGTAIRSWYGRGQRRKIGARSFHENPWVWFFMAVWGAAQFLPLINVLSSWLDFADYNLPIWVGIVGSITMGTAIWLLWRSHVDLDRQWSPSLQISNHHHLVTAGVYRYIRHPMYAAHFLWSIAQVLLVHNWIAGWAALLAFIPIYFLRVPAEEDMMIEQFGEEYQAYKKRTGRVLPRFRQ